MTPRTGVQSTPDIIADVGLRLEVGIVSRLPLWRHEQVRELRRAVACSDAGMKLPIATWRVDHTQFRREIGDIAVGPRASCHSMSSAFVVYFEAALRTIERTFARPSHRPTTATVLVS